MSDGEKLSLAAGCLFIGALVGLKIGHMVGYDHGYEDCTDSCNEFISMATERLKKNYDLMAVALNGEEPCQ